MTEEEFEQYLALGYEGRGYEFKGPGPRTDKWLFGKVLRAMMGMSNLRDGGLVILGVAEKKSKMPDPVGLNNADLRTWNYDDLAAGIAPYPVPSIRFDREELSYNGKNFLILRVHEFEDVPVICRKELQINKSQPGKNNIILKVGACYVRSRSKPETVQISTEADMRDLLDLATDKAVVRFIRRTRSLGFILPMEDREKFESELGDFQ